MDIQIKAKSSPSRPGITGDAASIFWLLYLLSSIGAIGGVAAYIMAAPLQFAGIFWLPASEVADSVMVFAVGLLMRVQPWLASDIRLDLPNGGKGCLLVSNHRSHLDAFLLLSKVKGVRILAKSSLLSIPFLGAAMRITRQIPVERGNVQSFLNAMEEVKRRVLQGEAVHVFPEMTRCDLGFEGVHDFAIAPFRAAREGGFPVIPIVFHGTDDCWPRAGRGIRFRRPVRVVALEAVDPRDFADSDGLMREVRSRIERELASRQKIAELQR